MKSNELIRYTDKFDDPNLTGEMQVTVTLKKVSYGTEVAIVQEAYLTSFPRRWGYLGWQESLAQFANLVESRDPRLGCVSGTPSFDAREHSRTLDAFDAEVEGDPDFREALRRFWTEVLALGWLGWSAARVAGRLAGMSVEIDAVAFVPGRREDHGGPPRCVVAYLT